MWYFDGAADVVPTQHDEGSHEAERHMATKKVGLGGLAAGHFGHAWGARTLETHRSLHVVTVESVDTPMEQLGSEHRPREPQHGYYGCWKIDSGTV